MNSSLHVVVALEEVGDLALAELGITEFTSGSSTAKHELTTLLRANL